MRILCSRRAVGRAALLLLLVVVAFSGWLLSYAEMNGPAASSETVIVTIPHRSSATHISHILAEAGLIHADVRFLILAKLTGFSKKFPAGEFLLATGMKPIDLMRQLSKAQPVQHPVTIPEGLRVEEIADIFSSGGWCDHDKFLLLVHDSDFISSLGLGQVSNLEGYLFPDTYYLTRMSSDAQSIIKMMVRRFFKVWNGLPKDGAGTLSERETIILASIVEKETADPAERPMIAAVFLNRLRLGMRLQSDPTVIYGIKNFSGNLTKDDLERYTPYNTYLTQALPPGPICNPGKDSLEAVLHPDKEPYLYFVSKNDGTHQFSTTLAEHNRAVWKYQKEKNIGGKTK
jgi:peptidoglycan lytic transglycosylase G